jgi:hypothetical protein
VIGAGVKVRLDPRLLLPQHAFDGLGVGFAHQRVVIALMKLNIEL